MAAGLLWIEREFGWSERAARRYMEVADAFSHKSATVADLTIDASALYVLASKSVPETVREEAVIRAEAGNRPL